jgi:hypothetical protein
VQKQHPANWSFSCSICQLKAEKSNYKLLDGPEKSMDTRQQFAARYFLASNLFYCLHDPDVIYPTRCRKASCRQQKKTQPQGFCLSVSEPTATNMRVRHSRPGLKQALI